MDKHLDQINEKLRLILSDLSEDNPAKAYIEYALFPGGKRLRPLLFSMFNTIYNKSDEKNLSLACAVELIHTYSLIHDDLPSMDNDDFRRGKESLHKRYGEAEAILTGDGLLNLAAELSFNYLKENDPSHGRLEACSYIFKASGFKGMVLGQMLDISQDLDGTDDITFMYEGKTGALLKASIVSPALIAEASYDEINILDDFASNFGLLFQVLDDIDDIEEDREIRKKTLISNLSLDEAMDLAKDLAIKSKHSLMELESKYSRPTNEVIDLINILIKRVANG